MIHQTEVFIDAPAEKVFDALTNPELVKQWQYDRQLITSWKVGEPIRFTAEFEGQTLEQWGTVLACQPNEVVQYDLFTPRQGMEDQADNRNITTYKLSAIDGKTKIELLQEDKRPGGFVAASIKPILLMLKKVVESN